MSKYRSLADNVRLYLFHKKISFFSQKYLIFFSQEKLISHCLGPGFPVWTEGLRDQFIAEAAAGQGQPRQPHPHRVPLPILH